MGAAEIIEPKRLVSVQASGESMEPALYENDVVVIDIWDTRLSDGVVYAFNYEGKAVVSAFLVTLAAGG